MTTQTMSITRALVELKRLNDRITTAIQYGKFVSRTVGQNKYKKVVGSNDTPEQMAGKIQASFDTVDSLIANRQKIKSAIVLSNANTKVTVNGQEMTVAEAIEMKGTVTFRNQYLFNLRQQQAAETRAVELTNTALEGSIDAMITTICGAEKSKIDANTLATIATPQKEQKEAAILDPAKIEDRITKLTEEISVLSSELDFTLSESNARTTITITV